ncbi:MAG: anaerobic sulfatase-maturation protein [Bacteroidales bacterium]|nr:anaerobic sulfatase-maturation protein [Bacteroidales bacterium]
MNPNLNKPVFFSVMAKPVSSACNLNCTYCYYLEKKKLYPQEKNFFMSHELLEIFVKNYISAQQGPLISFVWQGGEPTLYSTDFFKKAIELQQKYAGKKTITNAFQTNGTRLTAEWCELFRRNNFLVGISIDGPEHVHNLHRINKAGNPTFSGVMDSIEMLKKYQIEFNTLTVVHRESPKFALEIYRFLKQIGSGFMQFIPIVERTALEGNNEELKLVNHLFRKKAEVTPWSVLPEDYGQFLITIFDEWVRHDVGKYFVQLFDVTLANWVGENPGLCVFNETCGDAVVMEYNGDIYSCDHFVYPEFRLGNLRNKGLQEMVTSPEQLSFGMNKLNKLPRYCQVCEYRFACHGECPKHRFMKTPEGEYGLNYLCKGYKMFFKHVHPYMQFMGDELEQKRPPANVMAWAKKIIPGK